MNRGLLQLEEKRGAMIKYILKRLLWLIPILIGVSILIFAITYFTEGDPARIMMGSNATPQQLESGSG